MEDEMIASIIPAKKLVRAPDEPAVQLKGICATCVHVPGCVYIETPENPKMYCEQFESELEPTLKTMDATGLKSVRTTLEEGSKAIKQAKALGLCVNCAYLETCVFPRPEGGVWHCEEYR